MITINLIHPHMGNLMSDSARRRRFSRLPKPVNNYRSRPRAPKADQREARLLRCYGLTLENVASMIAAQGGRCPSCLVDYHGHARARTAPVVDHDHVTGSVRGILCNRCNMTLGLMSDEPESLRRLAAYVESHKP